MGRTAWRIAKDAIASLVTRKAITAKPMLGSAARHPEGALGRPIEAFASGDALVTTSCRPTVRRQAVAPADCLVFGSNVSVASDGDDSTRNWRVSSTLEIVYAFDQSSLGVSAWSAVSRAAQTALP